MDIKAYFEGIEDFRMKTFIIRYFNDRTIYLPIRRRKL